MGADQKGESGPVEQESKPAAGAGVTRGQNALYVMPHDWASIAHFLTPAVERVDADANEVQILVVTADAESAAAVAAAAVRLFGTRGGFPLAATAAKRAERLVKLRPPTLVAGSADVLLALVQSAALKLDGLRALILAWPDEMSTADESALEVVLGEVPKDAARTIVTSAVTPSIETLVERYARRARRIGVSDSDAAASVSIEYVSVAGSSRLATLRRLLDDQDPASALVITRSEESEPLVGDLLRSLGYSGAEAPVRTSRAGSASPVDLVVLYDLPASREELREAVGEQAGRVVALVQPRQLTTLRGLAAGGAVTPLTLSGPGGRARSREEGLRTELRERLSSGTFGRELIALEPLLEEYDGIEIAAAALQLLERARATEGRARTAAAVATSPAAKPSARPSESTGSMVRLFVNVGTMDAVRPADLVGAIVNEAGVPRESVGRIELRDNHSLVEIVSERAEDVASKLTGTSIRGRRVQARVDQERGPRSQSAARGGRAGEGTRPQRGGGGGGRSFGDRPRGGRTFNERGAPRGERDRGERDRGERDRGDRSRRPDGDRGPRRGPRRDDRDVSEGRASRNPRTERE